jgi:glycerophosphoryl diester phosphodiesterase
MNQLLTTSHSCMDAVRHWRVSLPHSFDSRDSWFLLCCIGTAFLVSFASPLSAEEPTPAQKLIASPRVLIAAHRGNSSVCPENTLPAFQAALDARADLVELDYFHSADGVPVVIHDEILDRTTDAATLFGGAEVLVGHLPLAELQRLDVGAWFDDKFCGTRVPTLAEALDLIQSRSVTLIERKGGDAATLVRLLEEKRCVDNVVVIAFDWQFVADCRRLAPRMVLGALCSKPATEARIRAAAATGADLIVWNQQKIGRRQIELIHQQDKRVWVYTVDDPQRASNLIAAGIDGIISNRPEEIMRVRNAERGVRSADRVTRAKRQN